jgi:hypothetical protein
MLGSLPPHLAKVTQIQVAFKLSPCIFDVKMRFCEVELLTFAAQKCWFRLIGEQAINSIHLNKLTGEPVVDGKFSFINLLVCKVKSSG